MNFTFNFFYPIVAAFTALWQPSCLRISPVDGVTTGCGTKTAGTATTKGRSRRSRTRVPRPTTGNPSGSGRPVLRRSARLHRKYAVPQKPILPPAPRRGLCREGAVTDLQQSGGNTAPTTQQQQLKREDSFILVDYGNHFRMVKPAYAMRYFHAVPENFRTVAPYHALGACVREQELGARLLAIPIDPTIGTKRVRFVDDEEPDDGDDARPRKRRRLS